MIEHRQFICVTCPVGCTIDATIEGGRLVETEGQACKRGIAFVQEELTAPKRMLTTTVRVREGTLPLVPVRSEKPLPKGRIMRVVEELRQVELVAPIEEHQIVLANACGTGVDIITSRSLARALESKALCSAT